MPTVPRLLSKTKRCRSQTQILSDHVCLLIFEVIFILMFECFVFFTVIRPILRFMVCYEQLDGAMIK